ncbi:fumarylacetoacetate hydrolase family protein [bacterium SCSIO 12643]|nr:fumarylacetoacetate hydrolase family protein [bacterium SCSIO 12643]
MKIICIGRNYAMHAKELNNPVPKEPVMFMKPDSALLQSQKPFFIPDFTKDVHHELEIVVKINRLGKHIKKKFAHKYYNSITVGIDFTARDVQKDLKSKGLPWEIAKAFDGSAPIGKFIPVDQFEDLQNLNFKLEKNGTPVQIGNTKDMLFDIDTLIEHISKYFTLKIGDLIYTGTPAGVGSVQIGDQLVASIEGQELLKTSVK